MKKAVMILLAVIILNFSSCETVDDMDYSYSIKDALKISAYLFDESIDGNVYDEDDSVYEFERLKINEARMINPTIRSNILFEFDGIIEVSAENEDLELSVNKNLTFWDGNEGTQLLRTYGYNMKFATRGFVGFCLLVDDLIGKPIYSQGTSCICGFGAEVGTERYLNVNAYRLDNEKTPIIRAKLKLILIEDKFEEKLGNANFSRRCFSIELISYEYSDIYKLLDDITDEED